MCKYTYVRRYEGTDKQTELIYNIKDKRQSKVLRIPSLSSVQISIPKRKIFGKYMGSCNDQHSPRLYEIKKMYGSNERLVKNYCVVQVFSGVSILSVLFKRTRIRQAASC